MLVNKYKPLFRFKKVRKIQNLHVYIWEPPPCYEQNAMRSTDFNPSKLQNITH